MPPVLKISGFGLDKELQEASVLLNRSFNGATETQVVDELLDCAETSWSIGTIDGVIDQVYYRYDGGQAYNGILKLAEVVNKHIRRTTLTGRQLDFSSFGVDSGVKLMNAEAVSPVITPGFAIVDKITVDEDYTNIINRIIPVGAGEGNNLFTLQWSTRSTPYAIQSLTGPGGELLYYIEDSASVTAHGRSTKVVTFKDVMPIANSPLAFENASNAVYDLAATHMSRVKDPVKQYAVDAYNIPASFRAGDTLQLIYKGIAYDQDGTRIYLDVNQQVICLERTRSKDGFGVETSRLNLSTVDAYRMSDQEIIVGALETLLAFKVSPKFYTFQAHHGTRREPIQFTSSRWFDYPIIYDAEVSYLLKCIVSVTPVALKSNVSDASAGGSTTSSVSGADTSNAGGGGTSGSHSGHSHSVSGGTSGGGSSHNHSLNTNVGPGPGGAVLVYPSTDPVFTSFMIPSGGDHWHDHQHNHEIGEHNHFLVANTSGAESSHSHSVSGQTANSGGSHSHSVDSHSHDIPSHSHTIGNHTHPLVYGIFLSTLPANSGLKMYINGVDRTSALGGGWGTAFEADVTQFLVDAGGQPLRQSNTIQIRKDPTSPDAIDVVVQARSLVTASAIAPS